MTMSGLWDVDLSRGRIVITFFVIFAISRVFKFINGLQIVSGWPGIRCAFIPFTFPGSLIPTSRWNPGAMLTWKKRSTLYRQYGTDTISIVPFIHGRAEFYTSNLEVVRQVVAGGIKSSWIKPESSSGVVLTWGMNLFVAEKETWQRHRKIISPAFNNRLYKLVWDKTMSCYFDMLSHEGWSTRDTVKIPQVLKYTSKFAFLLIATCGFGLPFTWSYDSSGGLAPKGEDESNTMTVAEALRVETSTTLMKMAPKWALKLPFKLAGEVAMAHEILDKFMHAQVDQRKVEVRTQLAMNEEGSDDIFSLLVRANEVNALSDQSRKLTLNDEELIGNVFLLLFAGHETTAHTLSATFALLAVHQDIQEEIYRQIMDVVGPDSNPKIEDYHKLDKVLYAFYEAARMFPAVYVMIREAMEDTTLTVPNPPGMEGSAATLSVRKGTKVIVDTIGLQYNQRYFSEPEKFDPSRWQGEDKVDAVTAFSIGPRNCIGRRFATTEAVALLTMWLRDWKVEPLLDEGETIEQWSARVIQAKFFLTLGIEDVPIQMTRREAFR
ncbi:hypothetical protein AcW1_010008 [Taiwanofungus camphoratus]|nr:hypothetical protein AcV5_003159 [Antrodia cinnamomea]KAI0929519.1 hypothetical protein AcV7_005353 [Antrodia cinnamomea]KAI0946578.1 hypothetical protein AcW1_010008 [Antrodia cinnamomea]